MDTDSIVCSDETRLREIAKIEVNEPFGISYVIRYGARFFLISAPAHWDET